MSHQDNEKNKRLRETIESLPPMTRDTAERAREFKLDDGQQEALDVIVSCGDWFVLKEHIEFLVNQHSTQLQAEARERLAAWMIERSFSTGHGDTFEDLLKELDWQVKELRGARLEEAKWFEYRLSILYELTAKDSIEAMETLRVDTIKRIAALAQALQPEEKEGTC